MYVWIQIKLSLGWLGGMDDLTKSDINLWIKTLLSPQVIVKAILSSWSLSGTLSCIKNWYQKLLLLLCSNNGNFIVLHSYCFVFSVMNEKINHPTSGWIFYFRPVSPLYNNKDFRLPKKLLKSEKDNFFNGNAHSLYDVHGLAEEMCRYDLDDKDMLWLTRINEDRQNCGTFQ